MLCNWNTFRSASCAYHAFVSAQRIKKKTSRFFPQKKAFFFEGQKNVVCLFFIAQFKGKVKFKVYFKGKNK